MDDSSWLNDRFRINLGIDESPSRTGDRQQRHILDELLHGGPNRPGNQPQSNPLAELFNGPTRPGDPPQSIRLEEFLNGPNRREGRPPSNPPEDLLHPPQSIEELINSRRGPMHGPAHDPPQELFNDRRTASNRQDILGQSFVESMERGRRYRDTLNGISLENTHISNESELDDLINGRGQFRRLNDLFGSVPRATSQSAPNLNQVNDSSRSANQGTPSFHDLLPEVRRLRAALSSNGGPSIQRPEGQSWHDFLNDHDSDDSDDDEPSMSSFREFLNGPRQNPNAERLDEHLHGNRNTRQQNPPFRSCPLHRPMVFHEPMPRPRNNGSPDNISSVNETESQPRENQPPRVDLMSIIHFQNPKTVNILVFLLCIVAIIVTRRK